MNAMCVHMVQRLNAALVLLYVYSKGLGIVIPASNIEPLKKTKGSSFWSAISWQYFAIVRIAGCI